MRWAGHPLPRKSVLAGWPVLFYHERKLISCLTGGDVLPFNGESEVMLIVGVDPGTAITGYGIVDYRGNKFQPVRYDCIKTSSKLPLSERLRLIYTEINEVLRSYKPEHFAVEALFFNKNTRTAMAVGQARGVVLLAAANRGLEVNEYTPLQVKQAVVGNGKAEKGQVQFMVKRLLNLPEVPRPDDVADALAVGICHAHRYSARGGVL